MKQLIIPIAIGLLAGLGGGTGYAYMKTSARYTADSTHVADSLKAHPPTDSTTADSTHHAAAAHDSVPADGEADGEADGAAHGNARGMDMPGTHEAAAPMTPADSIRQLDAARHELKSTSATPVEGKSVETRVAPATSTPAVVKQAREAAMPTALPEQRLAKIFSAMSAKDAAKVLDQMTDGDIRTILGMMSDRQAAGILTAMSATRAAAISKGSSKAPGGSL